NPSARSDQLERAMAPVVAHPDFHARILSAVRAGNQRLAHVEQVRKLLLLPRDLSQEHGEMTPTMKVRRREVEQKYAAQLDRLYQDDSFGLSV
ncbi:MAG TPA: long-chain fatty acid--CoA ligase, partial [Pseudomonadota bacterium]|nr:long-chain fatty acid--CoA ligase [Pseudomonadota bacterium]